MWVPERLMVSDRYAGVVGRNAARRVVRVDVRVFARPEGAWEQGVRVVEDHVVVPVASLRIQVHAEVCLKGLENVLHRFKGEPRRR
jgi:hypothetical protein